MRLFGPIVSIIITFSFVGMVRAQDAALSTAGAAYAPLDVGKKAQDPTVPMSHSQRDELLSEFKGLVHMGMHKVTLEHWEGKDMADCDRPERSDERWSYRCQIITGQGDGYYYFFPNEQ